MPLYRPILTAILLVHGLNPSHADRLPVVEKWGSEPVRFVGVDEVRKDRYDGALRHAIGAHHVQAVRANRDGSPADAETTWTYNHQPFLAYWNGRFYLQYLSDRVAEHTPPGRTLILTSSDGQNWSDPQIAFPVYDLPPTTPSGIEIPNGMQSVMHQRMGFYVAPNGKLLTLAFYSYCLTPRLSPNDGEGIGRVVREIREDGTFGPIYFIRYNRHVGWNETNTNYPFYRDSRDKDFLDACESLLADKLMTLQWWEEDQGRDGFFAIDPSDVLGEDEAASLGAVTTSAGAGKALCYYTDPDGVVVGIWKNQWSALSPDAGVTWTPRVASASLMTCGAKVWGQRTDDGLYALIYNHSATRRNRFPLVVMTGEDGHSFDRMLCLQGEVPPKRYQGIHKNPGPQYTRGILEGNGNPPGERLWIAYSMNKEDLWVSSLRVPVTGSVREAVNEDFEEPGGVERLEAWNLYQPMWAPVSIVADPDKTGNRCLELKDEDPYDYSKVERAFPESAKLRLEFRIHLSQAPLGRAVEIEPQDRYGNRPLRLRMDCEWLGLDHEQVFPLEPIPIETGKWYSLALDLDCESQKYDLLVDGTKVREGVAFAQRVETLERVEVRTGPYRGDVRLTVLEAGEPRPAGLYDEDLPGSGAKVDPLVVLIDDLATR